MQYQTCPHCGAHLDYGERCDCGDEKEPPRDCSPESGKVINTSSFYQRRGVLSSPKKEERAMMYDPANPQLSISPREDEHGRVIGLDFHRRKRQLTDGISPDELEDRLAYKAAEKPKAKLVHTVKKITHTKRPQTQEGEIPLGFYGRRDRQ